MNYCWVPVEETDSTPVGVYLMVVNKGRSTQPGTAGTPGRGTAGPSLSGIFLLFPFRVQVHAQLCVYNSPSRSSLAYAVLCPPLGPAKTLHEESDSSEHVNVLLSALHHPRNKAGQVSPSDTTGVPLL